jgi:hypothetical protein
MQRIDEIESPPIVGKYYLVPCINAPAPREGKWIVRLPWARTGLERIRATCSTISSRKIMTYQIWRYCPHSGYECPINAYSAYVQEPFEYSDLQQAIAAARRLQRTITAAITVKMPISGNVRESRPAIEFNTTHRTIFHARSDRVGFEWLSASEPLNIKAERKDDARCSP